jgi:hypothetical protein
MCVRALVDFTRKGDDEGVSVQVYTEQFERDLMCARRSLEEEEADDGLKPSFGPSGMCPPGKG